MSEKLPMGWAETIIGQILEFKYGKGLPARKRDNTGYPVYGSNGIVGYHSTASVERESIIIGRKGSVGEVHLSTEPCSPIDTTYFIDELFGQPIKYWSLYLKSLELGQLNKATAIPGLNRNDVYDLKISVPPIAEQSRIVSKLDCLLTKVDACKERLDKVPEIIKRFRQSVLSDAVSAKLTEDWREENLQSNSKRMLIDQVNQQRLTKYNELCKLAKKRGERKPKKPTNIDPKFDVDSNLLESMPEIPNNWNYVHIAFLTDNKPDSIVDGPFGSSINVKRDYIESGVPVVRINNIARFKFIDLNLKFLNPIKFEKLRRHNLLPGDVLFGKVGTIGNSCIYPDYMEEGMLSTTGSCRIRVDQSLLTNSFLCLALNSYRPLFNKIASAGLQAFLNMKTIKSFPLPLPPLQEQNEIVKRVFFLFSIADQFDRRIDKACNQIDKLTASILSKAFRGELVPQNPTDEPAELLLKHIRDEREMLVANKKKGGRTAKKKSGRGKKIKSQKTEAEAEPDPAVSVQLNTKVKEEKDREIKSRKQSVAKIDKRFEKTDILKAFRKAIFRQSEIDQFTLLRLVGQRLGVQRHSRPVRQELESYIRTAIRRKIIVRVGDGYNSVTPTINHYDTEYLIKIFRSVIRKGYEYERGHVVTEAAEYLGYDKVSDAFAERMKAIFRTALRRGELYRSGAYVGKP